MKLNSSIHIILVLLLIAQVARADLEFKTLDQLIAASDIIAVVTIDKSNRESMIQPSKTQHFCNATPAGVQNSIKGKTSETILIHHGSYFEDTLFEYGIGDYLVFLKWKRDKWIPTDGGNSSKYIKQGKVSGWSSSNRPEDSEQLQTAIEYIRTKS